LRKTLLDRTCLVKYTRFKSYSSNNS